MIKIYSNCLNFILKSKFSDLELIAIEKIDKAVTSVQSSRVVKSTQINNEKLLKLRKKLKACSTINDLPSCKWPKLPTSSNERKTVRVRTALNKRQQYSYALENCIKNSTEIVIELASIQKVSSSRKVGIELEIVAVINATLDIQQKFNEYIKALKIAIDEIDQVIKEIDLPCGKKLFLNLLKNIKFYFILRFLFAL